MTDAQIQLVKINIYSLIVLVGLMIMAYLIISGRSPIKNMRPSGVIVAKIFMGLLPASYLIWGEIPVLKDTFLVEKSKIITGAVSSVSQFPPGAYFWNQRILLKGDSRSYHLVFTNDVIRRDSIYEIHYLPNSRMIMKAIKIEDAK